MDAFNFSTPEMQAGRSPWVQSQPGFHTMFQVSQVYIVRTCLKKPNQARCSKVHMFHPGPQKAEADVSLHLPADLHREFPVSQTYIVILCLKQINTNKHKQKGRKKGERKKTKLSNQTKIKTQHRKRVSAPPSQAWMASMERPGSGDMLSAQDLTTVTLSLYSSRISAASIQLLGPEHVVWLVECSPSMHKARVLVLNIDNWA